MGAKQTQQRRGDPRVEGIATVGWVALAALGISIPLTAIAGAFTGLLAAAIPLSIIFGTGFMAMWIWSTGDNHENHDETERLKRRIDELEERLANLEMIDSLEAHFAQKHQASAHAPEIAASPPTMGPDPQRTTS